ncbi:MAG: hypothetical protein IAE79_19245 [Anaerolinea sp.]|nr:hypothetical protein [Anaerolinea sp.]
MTNKNFDWHSEEETGWEEKKPAVTTAVPQRRRWWPTLLLILTLLGIGSWLITHQVNARIAATTAQVEADVRAAHELVLDAAARHDGELLRANLSGRLPDWYAMQENLTDAGALFDRSLLGLTLAATQPDASQIMLDPEFRQAEVSFPRAYLTMNGEGVTQTVTLQQTAVYRRGAQRWLLASPATEFWGNRQTYAGDYLIMRYPARDGAWADRLAGDLDALLGRACATLADLNCTDERLRLFLDEDASALRVLLDPTYSWQRDSLSLHLPPLTVIGMPLDESGYRALYRAYGVQMVTAVISHLVAYDCCEYAPFYQALLDYELHQLDFKPWPVGQTDQRRVFTGQPLMTPLLEYWLATDLTYLETADSWLLYPALDFLLKGQVTDPSTTAMLPVTPIALQRAMRPHQSFISWLATAYAGLDGGQGSALLRRLEPRWWQYAYTQTLLTQGPPPLPYPQQSLLLSCESRLDDPAMTEVIALQQYDPAGRSWGKVEQLVGYGFITLLPDDETIVRNIWQAAEETWTLTLWRGSQFMTVATEAGLTFSFGQMDPLQQQMVVFTVQEEAIYPTINLINLADCAGSGCALTPLLGFPYWSPDGAHMLLAEFDENERDFFFDMMPINGRYVMFNQSDGEAVMALRLADAKGQPLPEGEVGSGYAPFWLNNTTYGFMRPTAGGQEIVIGTMGDGRLQPILTLDDLLPALPQQLWPTDKYRLGYAFSHPQQPDLLFVTLFEAAQSLHLFSFNQQTGAVTHHVHVPSYWLDHTTSLSPDGRWLLLSILGQNTPTGQPTPALYLHELATGSTEILYTGDAYSFIGSTQFDWSADGQWLAALMGMEGVALVIPGQDYIEFVPYEAGLCAAVSWINR